MKNMSFDKTIQIISNVGVIAGIAFLAVEISQNNQLLQTQTSLIMVENRTDFRDAIWSDRELAELAYSERNGDALDPVDQFRADMLQERTLIQIEWQYQQWAGGALPDAPVDFWRRNYRADPRRTVETFNRLKPSLSADFVEFFEQQILQD